MQKLVLGDCAVVLKTIESGSVDLVCTDPPYGFSFMNKDWDKAVPSVEIWRECFRVLKPGAFAFIMSAPRQDVLSQMIVRLGEAGFDTSFSPLAHCYASGFPKSLNVAKNIDKMIAKVCNAIKSSSAAKTAENNAQGQPVTSSDGSICFVVESAAISDSHLSIGVSAARSDENQSASRTLLSITVPEDALMLGLGRAMTKIRGDEASKIELGNLKSLDEQDINVLCAELIEDWRRTIFLRLKTDPTYATILETANASATNVIITESTKAHLIGSTADTLAKKLEEETAHLDGSFGGWQPKPAWEVIIVAMKPLSEKTYVDQALKNGKGVTWLDDCRIPTVGETIHVPQSDPSKRAGEVGTDLGITGSDIGKFQDAQAASVAKANDLGRFPANLLVSDDILNDGREWKGKPGIKKKMSSGFGQEYREEHATHSQSGMDDKGSFSRYFSLDSWASKLPEHVRKVFPFLIVPKASKREKNEGLDGFEEKKGAATYGEYAGTPEHTTNTTNTTKNTHATVKPLTLMSYLITLGSREGDVVLDPFAGSGTTCVAAKVLGRSFIGIEREEEYCKIAEARINGVEGEKVQITAFETLLESTVMELNETVEVRRARLIDEELAGRKLTAEEIRFLNS